MLSNNANPGAANTALTFTAVTASLNYLGVGGTGPGSDAAAIQAALQALPTIGANNVIVTPDATDTIFTITFVGALSGTTPEEHHQSGCRPRPNGRDHLRQQLGHGT